jgi:uncharacterized membrane protein
VRDDDNFTRSDGGRGGARTTGATDTTSLTTAGVLLGAGMGGFVDGIVLHQVLKWHHLLSTTDEWSAETVDDLEVNVLADGLFHAVTWVFVAVGIVVLWRVARDGIWRKSWRTLLGWVLVGWGAFNVVEGTLAHHLLQIHRVRPDAADPVVWDIGFLLAGALLIAGGWVLQRNDRTPGASRPVSHPRPERERT